MERHSGNHVGEQLDMDTFNPLDHPICFQVPDRVHVASAWYEHIPFAFYVTEVAQPKCFVELGTHNGVSFLAFCQAIQSLSLDTKTFAIDTWEGDEMAGYYGQEVFDELRAYHDSRYGKFSSLLRMTFDEGINYFSDGSIDLLHIDGLHTYEAVKHDFENWYRKLKPDAIVIFHDTNVHENDFGVWRYWEELKQKYTSFEFFHGHGLGVLTLADNFPLGLRVDKNGVILNKFRNFFAVLGQKHLIEYNLSNLQHNIEIPRGQVEALNHANVEANETIRRVTEENKQLEQIRRQLEMELAEEKANAEQTIQKHEKSLIIEKSNAKSRIQVLEQKVEDLNREISEKDEAHVQEQERLNAVNIQLNQEKALVNEQKDELEKAFAFAKKEIVDYYTSTSWKLTRPFRWISKKFRG